MTINQKTQLDTVDLINKIYHILVTDEELMRLLSYLPKGYDNEGQFNLEPLDASLPNIVDTSSSEFWEIADKSIVLGEKTSNLENERICRLYIHEGRSRGEFFNHQLMKQEIIIDVYIHEDFDKDLRISRINKRINTLIVLERLGGYGMLDYVAGNPREAPTHYRKFENIYRTSVNKK